MKRIATILLLGSALAEPTAGSAAEAGAPYTGLQQRPIKALSQSQIDDLRAGLGMGMALPAELNGYPGPRHVLELSDELALTKEQRLRTQVLFAEMEQQAVVLGEQVIAGEQALDQLFADGRADEDDVTDAVLEIGRLHGLLRAHHLRYHLTMRELLSPDQIARYNMLRGYAGSEDGADGHRHRRHHP